MIGCEFGVDALIEFAVAGAAGVEGFETAIDFRELLFDDIGFDGDAKVVGLTGEVSGEVVILVRLESIVAEVAPENGGHPKAVSVFEGLGNFNELAGGVIGSEVDGGTNGDCAHIPGLFDLGEHHLVGLVGVGQKFVVIDFDHERNFVGVFATDHPEDTEGGTDHIASAFDGEFNDSGGIEAGGVFGKRGTG